MKNARWGTCPPPPWTPGENESLDIAYYKVARALIDHNYVIVDFDKYSVLHNEYFRLYDECYKPVKDEGH